MNRETFIDAYVAAFMGSYYAAHFQEFSSRGWKPDLADHGSMSDAVYLAERAWDKLQELRPAKP